MIAVNSTKNNYCALIGNTDAKENQCDVKGGAFCHHVSGVQGVCTYTVARGNLNRGTESTLHATGTISPAVTTPEHFLLKLNTDVDGIGMVT